MTGRRCSPPT
jgi:hypothetical protein